MTFAAARNKPNVMSQHVDKGKQCKRVTISPEIFVIVSEGVFSPAPCQSEALCLLWHNCVWLTSGYYPLSQHRKSPPTCRSALLLKIVCISSFDPDEIWTARHASLSEELTLLCLSVGASAETLAPTRKSREKSGGFIPLNSEVNVSHKGHRQGEDSAAQSFQESDEKSDAIFWSVENLAGTSWA